MDFQIEALSPQVFAHYFSMSKQELEESNAVIVSGQKSAGMPCRVSLVDAEDGERVLLVNHRHLPVSSPYRAAHAIYVREGATCATTEVNEVPDQFKTRMMALRALGNDDMIKNATLATGEDIAVQLSDLLADQDVAYVHMHFAAYGCFAAKAVGVTEPS